MNYSTLLEDARKEIPEFNEACIKAINDGTIYEDSGMHIVFGRVFVPMLEEVMQKKDKSLLERMFSFMEKMERSGDAKVAEVCEFTILEDLCDDYDDDEIIDLLPEETKLAFKKIREYMPEYASVW